MSEDVHRSNMSADDLSALLAVSLSLADSLDAGVVHQTAVDAAVRVLGADTGALYALVGDHLELRATTLPLIPPVTDDLRVLLIAQHPHIARALSTNEPMTVADIRMAKDVRSSVRIATELRKMRSVIYLPLVAKGTPEGVIIASTCGRMTEFDDHTLDVGRTLAAQIALALQNARLLAEAQATADELRETYDATLEGWSEALEMRYGGTAGHTTRAAELACDMARELGIPAGEIPHVRRGALLHDIGKMAVPDEILKKPGPLTDEEWAVIRSHPVFAHEFLSRIGYLGGAAIDIPCYHHERWDGTGYPNGLRGTKIPLAARIYAVIDVYDALTSDRPFRKAWSPREAMAHILGQAGTHFDPVVVAAFAERVDALLETGN
jgi:putative nucleotidyltransferase with HDIG domain